MTPQGACCEPCMRSYSRSLDSDRGLLDSGSTDFRGFTFRGPVPPSVSPQREDKQFGSTEMEWPLIAEMQQRLRDDGVRRISTFVDGFRCTVTPAKPAVPDHVLTLLLPCLLCASVMALVRWMPASRRGVERRGVCFAFYGVIFTSLTTL